MHRPSDELAGILHISTDYLLLNHDRFRKITKEQFMKIKDSLMGPRPVDSPYRLLRRHNFNSLEKPSDDEKPVFLSEEEFEQADLQSK